MASGPEIFVARTNHMTCGELGGNKMEARPPFVIKCLSEECTVIMAEKAYTVGQIDDEINSGSEFGKKLKIARDEVAALV